MLKLQYLGHLMWRANSLEKTLIGKDWRREEKGVTEDKIVEEHHWLNGHEFVQAPGDGEGQESPACCSPLDRRIERNWATEQLFSHHLISLRLYSPQSFNYNYKANDS